MSFRTRLTSFFALIVVVPMVAVGFLVFRLISDSEQGKADARASGLASAAASIYSRESASARADAKTIATDAAVLKGPQLSARLSRIANQAGLARVTITRQGGVVASVGDQTAIAPGVAEVVSKAGSASIAVAVSTITAAQYARDLTGTATGAIIRQGRDTLSSTLVVPVANPLAGHGQVSVGGVTYRYMTQRFPGFGDTPVDVTVFSDLSATSSAGSSRLVAAIFIAAFLLLALSFSVLASRALQGQLSRFLEAARRLGAGDFTAQVPIDGRDEFAALGVEFNNMSSQLAHRLDELSQERARLRDLIRRIGETFASNLDRPALLELALRTAVDAVQADCGRLSARATVDEPLEEISRVGSLDGLDEAVYDAERVALTNGGLGESAADKKGILCVALGSFEPGERAHGLITVARGERPFNDDDRELLRSLASQATLALENVELHFQVRRQAVTDELTGLANHGRFQDLLSAEMEQVRRYHHTVGLIMLDLDDFKSVNDTYGHQQGDVVLKHVARALRATSRDADIPARYGGEEMVLILPHTDLEGSFAIAERLRTEIEALRIPRLDQEGALRITASLGVASSSEGLKDALIADADAALYAAKRQGKNRTLRAVPETANLFGPE
jgi:diguanylate cyclase (GGDEF)-like protein